MRPDRLTVYLRPRSQFEAIDLGYALLRRHAREIWRHWLLLVMPVMLLLAAAEFLFFDWLQAGVFIWWGKPFYDAVVLLVLSRAVFGDSLSPRETLHELRRLPGVLFASLTLRRFSLSRSFLLPAHLLEGLRGPARTARIRLLRQDSTAGARLLTMCSGWLELAMLFGMAALFFWLAPAVLRPNLMDALTMADSVALQVVVQALYMVAISIAEPFYVAAGFALYLNRRTMLEAWDIEVALKRLAARLPAREEAA